MAPGKGAARAIWAQSVEEEAASFDGEKSAAVLVDLVKAFEQVSLGSIWHVGLDTQFHPCMLRLAIELCTARRRLMYTKAASQDAARTLTAILAGFGVATNKRNIIKERSQESGCGFCPTQGRKKKNVASKALAGCEREDGEGKQAGGTGGCTDCSYERHTVSHIRCRSHR